MSGKQRPFGHQYSVLFVCLGNSCRSPMAEALMKKVLSDRGVNDVEVRSAGVAKGFEATPESVKAMADRGINLEKHRTRWVGNLDWQIILPPHIDLIVAMTSDVRQTLIDEYGFSPDKVIVANEANGGVPNPWKKGQAVYNETARVLEQVANELADRIAKELME